MFKRTSIERMFHIRLILPIAAFVIGVAMAGPSQARGTVINVSLWDKGADAAMATDLGFPAGGKDMSKVTMGIALSADAVDAGEVTFEVLNSSTDMVHEMIVTKLEDVSSPLPFNSNENRVDEDKAGDLGEVSELDPGKTGALRLDLKPGKYLLFCNIPGHFTSGMWTVFTVK